MPARAPRGAHPPPPAPPTPPAAGVYRERKTLGLALEPVALHMGFIPGFDKARLYAEEGLFHPEFRLPVGAGARAAPAAGLGRRLTGGGVGAGGWAPARVAGMVPLSVAAGVWVGRGRVARRARR